jgi:hypothetical protein
MMKLKKRRRKISMQEFKSVQDLIIKAALYDGVTTTISPHEYITGDTMSITFSKGNRHSATHFCVGDKYGESEAAILYCCKSALLDLFFAPYKDIEVHEESQT